MGCYSFTIEDTAVKFDTAVKDYDDISLHITILLISPEQFVLGSLLLKLIGFKLF